MPVVAILVVAAVARYWGIGFCLPTNQCRPDEEAVANIVYRLYQRHFNPSFFDWPSLFPYAVALCLIPFFKVGRYRGWFHGERHFSDVIGTDNTPILIAARLLSVAAGVISVWLVYRVALRLFGRTTSLVAALFLALAFLHVRDSHFGVTDVTATCFILASFLFTVRLADSGATRDLIAAAVAAGLATSTKYNAALIAAPALWVVLRPGGEFARPLSARLARAALVLSIMLLAFVLTSPYTVLDYPRFFESLRAISSHLAGGHGVMLGRGWFVHLDVSLRYGLGWPLLAAGLAGLALLFWRTPRTAVMVGIFPIGYYLLIGGGYTVFARYIVPVIPFLCLSAAFAVAEVGRWAAGWIRRPGWTPALTWSLAIVVVAPSAWSVVQFDRLLARPDSRVIVQEWIKQRFPEGVTISTVGKQSARPNFLWEAPGVPPRYQVLDVDAATSDPDLLVVATSLFAPHDQLGDRATALVGRYRLVYTVQAHDPAATGVIYDWQDEFYLPLTGFKGVFRPGPSLTVYARPDRAASRQVP